MLTAPSLNGNYHDDSPHLLQNSEYINQLMSPYSNQEIQGNNRFINISSTNRGIITDDLIREVYSIREPPPAYEYPPKYQL